MIERNGKYSVIRYELKSFSCRTMTEAIATIRKELGNDALIMHTREIRRNILQRIFDRPSLEVVGGVKARSAADSE